MFIPFFYQVVIIAILAGFLTGLERAHHKRQMAGIRFFILVALISSISAYVGKELGTPVFIAIALAGILIYSIILIRAANYKANYTTGLAVIAMSLIGVLAGYGYIKFALAGAVILPLILIFKDELEVLEHKYKTKEDVLGGLKFLVIALILLPLIPNRALDPWGIINLFHLVLFIVLITGVQFIAYIIAKIWKAKGTLLSGTIIGFVNSDVIGGAMAGITKKHPSFSPFAAAAVTAGNASAVVRNLIIVAPISLAALQFLLAPSLAMVLITAVLVFFTLRRHKEVGADFKVENPFDMSTAIQFAVIALVVSVVAYVANIYIGTTGIYLAAILGSLAGDTPVIVAALLLLSSGEISALQMAAMVLINSFVTSLNDGLVIWAAGAKSLAMAFFKRAIPIVIGGLIVLIVQFFIF